MLLGAITRLLILMALLGGLLIALQEIWPGYFWWLGGVVVLFGCGFAMLNLQHLIKSRFESVARPGQLWPTLILLALVPPACIHWLFNLGSFSTAGLFVVLSAYGATVVQSYNRIKP